MIYCFDIDGTLAETDGNDYEHASPILEAIKKVNALFAEGHSIIIFSARGSKSGKDWLEFTQRQLALWGLEYDALLLGKPHADYYIDDKAVNAKEWLSQIG